MKTTLNTNVMPIVGYALDALVGASKVVSICTWHLINAILYVVGITTMSYVAYKEANPCIGLLVCIMISYPIYRMTVWHAHRKNKKEEQAKKKDTQTLATYKVKHVPTTHGTYKKECGSDYIRRMAAGAALVVILTVIPSNAMRGDDMFAEMESAGNTITEQVVLDTTELHAAYQDTSTEPAHAKLIWNDVAYTASTLREVRILRAINAITRKNRRNLSASYIEQISELLTQYEERK